MLDSIKKIIEDASGEQVSILTLLRRSKVIATDLKLNKFLHWISSELKGYTDEVPSYREIKGVLKGLNPYRGWVSVTFTDTELIESISQLKISQPISEIEELLNHDKGATFSMRCSAGQEQTLGEAVGFQTEFAFEIQRSQIRGIVEAVRNNLLDHLLELKKIGIKDSENASELQIIEAKKVSQEIYIENIENFQGNIGHSNQVKNPIIGKAEESFLNKFFWHFIIGITVAVISGIILYYIVSTPST